MEGREDWMTKLSVKQYIEIVFKFESVCVCVCVCVYTTSSLSIPLLKDI